MRGLPAHYGSRLPPGGQQEWPEVAVHVDRWTMKREDRLPGLEPVDQDPAPIQASPSMQGMPRGVLVFPFVVASALTLVVLVGLGEPIRGRGIMMALLVGGVASASSMAWHWTHRPSAAGMDPGVSSRPPAKDTGDPQGDPEPDPATSRAQGSESDGAGQTDPLAHIHAVESQARRHQKPCPNCGTGVGVQREQCPNCGHQLLVHCKGCRTRVRLEWAACPECGRTLP